jgi:GntR family transcriptional regulator
MLVRDPIYTQLNQLLRDQIRKGTFQGGERFLTERQVSEQFAVSRATANKALSSLVAEGLLEFRKGIGTFVRGNLLDYDLRVLVSFTEKARAAGKTPATQTLRFETHDSSTVPGTYRLALGLSDNETVHYIERLRLADDLPVILERRYLRARFCPGLEASLLDGSLYALLTQHFGLDVSGADETIHAVLLTGEDAELLKTDEGAAGLLVTAIGYVGTEDTPLWYEWTLYRGDAYEFRNRLGPVQHARPAAGMLRLSPGEDARTRGGSL